MFADRARRADAHFALDRHAGAVLAEIVARALGGLKRSENEARVVKQYDEVYELLLLPAFLLLVGEACMSERRRRAVAR